MKMVGYLNGYGGSKPQIIQLTVTVVFRDQSNHPYITKMPRYFRRMFWLIRNPSYGFNWTVLATKPLPYNKFGYIGNLSCDTSGNNFGVCLSWIEGTVYFHFKAYLPTFKGKCLKLRFGWNLSNSLLDLSYPNKVLKYCFTCNPFKSYQ